jgi:putative redox protein
MPTELIVHAEHQGDMRWSAAAGGHSISMDYPIPAGPGEAMKPLEVLMASLAGCAGNTLVLLLKRSGQPVSAMSIDIRAARRDEHPTVLTEITLNFAIAGTGIDPAIVERAMAQSEEHLCPVWAMLKPGTSIKSTFRIMPEQH